MKCSWERIAQVGSQHVSLPKSPLRNASSGMQELPERKKMLLPWGSWSMEPAKKVSCPWQALRYGTENLFSLIALLELLLFPLLPPERNSLAGILAGKHVGTPSTQEYHHTRFEKSDSTLYPDHRVWLFSLSFCSWLVISMSLCCLRQLSGSKPCTIMLVSSVLFFWFWRLAFCSGWPFLVLLVLFYAYYRLLVQ